MKVFYWRDVPNAGDFYSIWLAQKLYTTATFSLAPDLIITGSILSFNLPKDCLCLGAGLAAPLKPGQDITISRKNILAVRGKLTAKEIICDNVSLGDPGLLASKFYNPKTVDKKPFCIISHWRDEEGLKKLFGNKVDIISMKTNNIESLFDSIASYELVFSTSLHGIIFAHSFGIPAMHLAIKNSDSHDFFKYKDYYSVLDIPYKPYIPLNLATADLKKLNYFYTHKDDLELLPSKNCITKIQATLLSCFPPEAKLNQKTKEKVNSYLYF